MNAAFLILSSAALVGADPAPPPPPAGPVVISTGAGCSNCGPVATGCGCERQGILDRFKARVGGLFRRDRDCGCAPACAPVAPPPPSYCSPCVADRPNLLDTLKARWGKKKGHGPCCDPCGAAHLNPCPPAGPVVPPGNPPGTGTPPKEMPKGKDTGKGNESTNTPNPLPSIPPTPAPGVSGSSPY